jgi:hypothetical protein
MIRPATGVCPATVAIVLKNLDFAWKDVIIYNNFLKGVVHADL